MFQKSHISTLLVPLLISTSVIADESLLGRDKGSETLPQGAFEFDQTLTYRDDKGAGYYDAFNSKTELEYDVTNKLTASAYKLNDDISNNIGATLSAPNVTGRQSIASIASSGVVR